MGLDSFKDDSNEDVSTRKQLKNVKLDEEFWNIMLTTHPGYATLAANFTDETSAKAIIQKIDEILNDEIEGHGVSEDQKETIRKERQEIVESNIE